MSKCDVGGECSWTKVNIHWNLFKILEWAFTLSLLSHDLGYWTFNNGVSIHEELNNINLSKICAICNQQSWTKWMSIASWNRLYQFIALSDNVTQWEMRLKAQSSVNMNSGLSSAHISFPADSMSTAVNGGKGGLHTSTSNPRGTKRYFMSHMTQRNKVVEILLDHYWSGCKASTITWPFTMDKTYMKSSTNAQLITLKQHFGVSSATHAQGHIQKYTRL